MGRAAVGLGLAAALVLAPAGVALGAEPSAKIPTKQDLKVLLDRFGDGLGFIPEVEGVREAPSSPELPAGSEGGAGGNPNNMADDDVVDIKDAVLREVINGSTNPDKPITCGQLKRRASLTYNPKPDEPKIKTLEGFECAINVGYIELANNDIDSLAPLRFNAAISQMFASGNRFTSLAGLESSKKLNYLQFNNNKALTDISAVRGSEKLIRLEVANTSVSKLDALADVPNLQEIYAQDSGVTDVTPLKGLQKLRTISLPRTLSDEGPGITDLSPIAGLGNLQILNINRNSVTDISMLDSWPKLHSVGFNKQRATTVPKVFASATEEGYQNLTSHLPLVGSDGQPSLRVLQPTTGGGESAPAVGAAYPSEEGGVRWPRVAPDATQLEARFVELLGEGANAPRFEVDVTYSVERADFVNELPPLGRLARTTARPSRLPPGSRTAASPSAPPTEKRAKRARLAMRCPRTRSLGSRSTLTAHSRVSRLRRASTRCT